MSNGCAVFAIRAIEILSSLASFGTRTRLLRQALTRGFVIRVTLLRETAGFGAGVLFATIPRARN